MKKILFAVTALAFVLSSIPQTRGADVSIDFIYDNLSGGNWIDVEGYGYGWQPDVVVRDPNWRPYSDGYWAYTDYGWTWISYEDFGWATYHYGRWANLADYGWVWFPGEDLDWGPAWVSWRTGGDYIGWAPLPPRGPEVVYEGRPIGVNVDVMFDIGPEYYNFCDVRFIGEPVLRDRIFPPVQNVTYITNTVNVTNITVQNNVVYNYGPDFAVVNRYSSRPIQRLTIERETSTNLNTAVKSGTLTKVQGNKLLVAAPQKIAKAAPTMKPPAVKAKVAQPRIERGWKGVPNKAELEQKIKTENPKNIPPPTRAAAREGGGPGPVTGTSPRAAERGSEGAPVPRGGRAGRVPPGTQEPSLGESAARPEREKAMPGTRPRPGTKAEPEEGTGRLSPAPAEEGKPGGRARPAVPPRSSGHREDVSPVPPERTGSGPAREPLPREGETGEPRGSGRATPPSRLENAPSQHQEPRRQPPRQPSEEPNANRGRPEQNPSQGHEQEPPRQRFGTPAPMGAGERGQPEGGAPSRPHPQIAPDADAGHKNEEGAQRERMQGARGQQQQQPRQQREQQRGGAPASANQGQGRPQPQGGRQRQPRQTPPPGQQ
jgi:hypothetical protein